MGSLKRFADFAKPPDLLDGDKISIDRAVNRELTVLAYRIGDSKFDDRTAHGKCMTMQVELAGERRVIFTASAVLMEQLQQYKDELPFMATIQKIDKYYRLT